MSQKLTIPTETVAILINEFTEEQLINVGYELYMDLKHSKVSKEKKDMKKLYKAVMRMLKFRTEQAKQQALEEIRDGVFSYVDYHDFD